MLRECVQPLYGAVRPGVREEGKTYASVGRFFVRLRVPLC